MKKKCIILTALREGFLATFLVIGIIVAFIMFGHIIVALFGVVFIIYNLGRDYYKSLKRRC
jgi:hypothetical protein